MNVMENDFLVQLKNAVQEINTLPGIQMNFAVGQDEKSEAFVNKILNKMPELVYYFPSAQSSPPYITLPTEQAGIPTVNYETYCYEPINTTYDLMNKFVDTVDSLEF